MRTLTLGEGLEALLKRAAESRFVLLGEATHGTHEFYVLRAELTLRLVADHGFVAVAAEADWPAEGENATRGDPLDVSRQRASTRGRRPARSRARPHVGALAGAGGDRARAAPPHGRMGLTRQTVHTTVNRLLADGLVELVPNADHRRSQLVSLTELGHASYRAIDEKQVAWVNRLAAGLRRSELETTARVLGELCTRLEADSHPS